MSSRPPTWPRMMRRGLAAAYCDLSTSAFEREIARGRLPLPIKFGDEDHWSRDQIDEALDRLTGTGVPDWRKEQPGLAA